MTCFHLLLISLTSLVCYYLVNSAAWFKHSDRASSLDRRHFKLSAFPLFIELIFDLEWFSFCFSFKMNLANSVRLPSPGCLFGHWDDHEIKRGWNELWLNSKHVTDVSLVLCQSRFHHRSVRSSTQTEKSLFMYCYVINLILVQHFLCRHSGVPQFMKVYGEKRSLISKWKDKYNIFHKRSKTHKD